MKRLFFSFALSLVLFLAVTSLIHAEEYEEAMKRAQKEDKPVVIYFFSRLCPYCDEMNRYVLSDREVSNILKRWVVFITVDINKNNRLTRMYDVWGYPTTWFLDPKGQPIVKVPGYIPKTDFKKMLVFVKEKHYTSMTLREFFGM
jgi:thioredoxin-related protein